MTTATPLDLDRYTDSAAMRPLLQARLPGFAQGHLRIDALAVRHVRRNTSLHRNPYRMTLCYELQVSDPARGRSGMQTLFAQVFRDGGAAAVLARQDAGRLTPPAFGEALAHLPDLDLLLWALPNDPGLPQLASLLDAAQLRRMLPGGAEGDVQVELLRHAPGQRATLRCTVAAGTDSQAPRTLYAKTFRDDRAALIHERFAHFWQLAQDDATAPLVARPLGHHAGTRSVWLAPAAGVPLLDALASQRPHDGPRLMGSAARALARLHAAALRPSADAVPRSVPHWLAEVRRRRNKIARIDAALAPQAAAIAEAIEAHAAHPATRPLSLIHGDFHPEQIWVHGERAVLFDFDEFTFGGPMEDVAEFVLKLEHAGAAPALAGTFVEQYARHAPQHFDRHCLAWHLTIQSLLQASRAFVYQQPGWASTLAQRLAACAVRAAALPMEPTTP